MVVATYRHLFVLGLGQFWLTMTPWVSVFFLGHLTIDVSSSSFPVADEKEGNEEKEVAVKDEKVEEEEKEDVSRVVMK